MLSWASGLVATAFIGYYGILALGNPPSVIGEQFVLAEFPPTSISPWFFAMPMYSLYFLHRVEKEIEKLNPTPAPIFSRQESYGVDTMRNIPITRSYSFAFTTGVRDPVAEYPQPT